ncbi:MAG: hypothetical protein ACYC6L_13090 [Anaerolineae bacterium]
MKRPWHSLIIITLIAITLRAWAVVMLPEDFDEPGYLQNGFDYAALIHAGNLNGVMDYPGNYEHPAFVKLVYAGDILLLGKDATWVNAFYLSRVTSAFFGVLAVVLLAAYSPLAGAMLAVHTYAIKYSSQVYLDAIPFALTLCAILAMLRYSQQNARHWFWLSAFALGLAAAGKYLYLPTTIMVLVYLMLVKIKVRWTWIVGFTALSLDTFIVFNVHFWHDPLNRFIQQISYHFQYAHGTQVQQAGYPWYQPFVWVFSSAPAAWHPKVFFYYGFDGIVSVLALFSIPREYKQRPWLIVWLVTGIVVLLLWPTKWPQYVLIIAPPLCVMGAATLQRWWAWLRSKEGLWDYLRQYVPVPSKWFWWLLAVFVLFIGGIYVSAWSRLAVGRIGWSHITRQSSALPGNVINGLLELDQNRILIATDQGAAIFTRPDNADLASTWITLDSHNSGLPNDNVRALLLDASGTSWFGTNLGVSRTRDFITWTTFNSSDLRQTSAVVTALAATRDGRIIAGTLSGASIWDGQTWTAIPELEGQAVFSLTAAGDAIWFGTNSGAWRLEPGNLWTFYAANDAIKQILVDSNGTVWAATAGSGLAFIFKNRWEYYSPANSDLAYSLVNCLAEVKPGQLWLGLSLASKAGGVVETFYGNAWRTFNTLNSGFNGAEPRYILRTADNEVWIGTAGQGIDIYQLEK